MIHFITTKDYKFKSDKIIIEQDLTFALTYLSKLTAVGLDTETTGLDPLMAKLLLLQIGDKQEQFVIDAQSIDISPLYKILTDEDNITKVLHNAKFDYKMIKSNLGIEVENVFDTMLMEQLITNGMYDKNYVKKNKPYSLASLIKKYTNVEISKKERETFINNKGAFKEEQIIYAANDIIYALDLARYLLPQIKKYELKTVAKLENEVVLAYGDMELNGFKLDSEKWTKIYNENYPKFEQSKEKLDQYVRSKPTLYNIFKRRTDHSQQLNLFAPIVVNNLEINWSTPQQVLEMLHADGYTKLKGSSKNDLELFVNENEKTGIFTAIKPEDEVIALILNYRSLFKAVTTYGIDFLKHIHPKTGRIHPNFFQISGDDSEDSDGSGGTATGRVSCQNPNLQNIKRGSAYRECFVSEPDNSLITNDYSGCELRFIAEGSGDPTFVHAFNHNIDVHSQVATMLFRKPVIKTDKKTNIVGENEELRTPAKTLNFGLAYGMGAEKLGRKLRIPTEEAQKLIDLYFNTFPLIKKYLNEGGQFALANGYIRTPAPYGRIRWFPGWEEISQNFSLKGQIERAGTNTKIQGANADLTKKATVLIRRWIKAQNAFFDYAAIMLVNQVHDEIVIECNTDIAETVQSNILFLMELAANDMVSKVPMIAESKISTMWSK